MKIKDIEGALSLIAAFKNADWVDQHLKALLEAKVIADKAIVEQRKISDDVTMRQKELSAHAGELAALERDLANREARLRGDEQQWRLVMAREETEISHAKSAHNALVEETKQAAIQQAEVLDRRSKELDQREKAVARRELAAVQRDEQYTQREQAFQAEVTKHQNKVAKLRELTA